MTLKTLIAELKRITSVILTSFLVYLTSPLFICYFSFFWLLRYFLTLWKNVCHPQFGPLLGGLDSVFVNESPYTTDQKFSVCYFLTVQGKIELEEFRKVVRKGLKKFSQGNESSRRLTQFFTKWMGYFVGEDEKNIKLEDHVRLFSVEELNKRFRRQCGSKAVEIKVKKKIHKEHFTDDELAQLNWSILKVPYEEKTSPWEILLVHNPPPKPESKSESKSAKSRRVSTKNDKCTTVIILRFHHSLSDGKATTSFFSHFFDQSQEYSCGRTLEFFDSKNKSSSLLQSITQNFTHFILGLPQFISHVQSCKAVDWPPLFLPFNYNDDNDDSSSSGHTISIQFPKDKIQRIQKFFSDRSIKSTTVLHAVLALSVTEFFKGYRKKHEKALPDLPPHIFVLTPMGDPSAKNELTNKLTMLGVKVPLGSGLQGKDPKTMLKEIQESYSYEADSRIRHVSKIFVNLIGLLPANLKPPLISLCKGLCISHNPSFENPVTILGKPVTSARGFGCEFPMLSCITLINFVTRDEIQGTFLMTKQVIESYEDAKALANCFVKKFDDLYQDLLSKSRAKK